MKKIKEFLKTFSGHAVAVLILVAVIFTVVIGEGKTSTPAYDITIPEKDMSRYRWLKAGHWSVSPQGVKVLRLGTLCPIDCMFQAWGE